LLVLTKAEKVYRQGHFIDHSRSLEIRSSMEPLCLYDFIVLLICVFCVFTLSVIVFTAIVLYNVCLN